MTKSLSKIILCFTLFMVFLGFNSKMSLAESTNITQYKDYQIEALNYINEFRSKEGLKPLKLNPIICKAAEAHAAYYNINKERPELSGLGAHDEIKGSEGYTGASPGERVQAAGGKPYAGEVMTFGVKSSTEAIIEWLNTYYHRTPFTDPLTDEFGIGIVNGIAVLDYTTDYSRKKENKDVVGIYPFDGMENVPIGFYGNELPNPLEKYGVNQSGFIISMSTPWDAKNFISTLTNEDGTVIPLLSNDFCIIPKNLLDYEETYKVSVNYNLDGKNINKTWSFKTQSIPESEKKKDIIKININGKQKVYSQKPIQIKNRVLVPLRSVFESLNAIVSWDEATKSITVNKDNNNVKLSINSKIAYINNKMIEIDQEPIIINQTTYIPVRFVSESIGAKVQWDSETNTVLIDK